VKHKAKVTKVLLVCGLLLYVASVFLPWLETSAIGGNVITYWSFKARVYPYPYPHFRSSYEEMYFYSSWFISQILTLLFGLFSLLMNGKQKYESAFLGLTLLFSAITIGTCILTAYPTGVRIIIFLAGFWIASFAFLLFFVSLGVFLIK